MGLLHIQKNRTGRVVKFVTLLFCLFACLFWFFCCCWVVCVCMCVCVCVCFVCLFLLACLFVFCLFVRFFVFPKIFSYNSNNTLWNFKFNITTSNMSKYAGKRNVPLKKRGKKRRKKNCMKSQPLFVCRRLSHGIFFLVEISSEHSQCFKSSLIIINGSPCNESEISHNVDVT